jgi:hypothetical protein
LWDEVLMALTVKITVSWDAMPCSLIGTSVSEESAFSFRTRLHGVTSQKINDSEMGGSRQIWDLVVYF